MRHQTWKPVILAIAAFSLTAMVPMTLCAQDHTEDHHEQKAEEHHDDNSVMRRDDHDNRDRDGEYEADVAPVQHERGAQQLRHAEGPHGPAPGLIGGHAISRERSGRSRRCARIWWVVQERWA